MKLSEKNRHKRDNDIVFDKAKHTYIVNGIPYTSVTKFVGKFFPEFNSSAVIDKMMASPRWPESTYFGMTKEEITRKWNTEGKESTTAGTALHRDIERFYDGETVVNNSAEWKQFLKFIDEHKDLEPHRAELMIYDEETRIAGTVDMLFRDVDSDTNPVNSFVLCDWKRTKEIKMHNDFENALSPISHLPNTNFWKYALQQNIYKMILEKNYGFKLRNLHLAMFHPSKNSYEKFAVPDLQKEINDMLKVRFSYTHTNAMKKVA